MSIINEVNRFNLESGRVFLWGELTEDLAKEIIHNMRYIFFHEKNENIYLYIHSDGGEFDAECAIIAEMEGLKELGAVIHTIAVGKACSAAADILAVGSERYATKYSTMMMHPASYAMESEASIRHKKIADFSEKHYKEVLSYVARSCGYNTKKKLEQFYESVDKELWLDTDSAKKFGLIDGLWDYGWEKDITKVVNDKQ